MTESVGKAQATCSKVCRTPSLLKLASPTFPWLVQLPPQSPFSVPCQARRLAADKALTHADLRFRTADNRLVDAPGEISHMRLLAVCDLSHQTSGTASGMQPGAFGLLQDLPVSLRMLGLLQVCCPLPL